MAEFVADCPRCSTRGVTFVVRGDMSSKPNEWATVIEAFSICRICGGGSIGVFHVRNNGRVTLEATHSGKLSSGNGMLLDHYRFQGFLIPSTNLNINTPDHLPKNVDQCFREGATCFTVGAWNASAAMFRLALDLATKDRLPDKEAEEGGPNAKQRKVLFDRLEFLFGAGLLPSDLRELADCIREDGNDGAHDGTLTKADAEDLIDFAEALLERVYTEPARIELAKARRIERRSGGGALPAS
ncbi:MAG TPA: DUF4145 domain-containing protein [Candidatus Sphingomonas excrementigallinarum]|nr:DUF4145 domain-containing protein [Candidatus Sphingomonas excrementigallinarum]